MRVGWLGMFRSGSGCQAEPAVAVGYVGGLAHLFLPGFALGVDEQQLAGEQPDGVGFGADQVGGGGEETLPKIGHSTYRADFGLPRLGVLVEAKYARHRTDFKKIEKEVMEDSVAYLRDSGPYQEIIVFIYDESALVQEHDITAAALRELDTIGDVVIVSRPSRLPVPDQRSRRAQRKRAITT
jgi:REase_DpnII-MboI